LKSTGVGIANYWSTGFHKRSNVLSFDKKWVTLCAIFSQTHLVTPLSLDNFLKIKEAVQTFGPLFQNSKSWN
jgi:hypothetical protein